MVCILRLCLPEKSDKEICMRISIIFAVLWCFSVQANAAPIWTYDLEGTVSGSEEAAGYLADIGVGDPSYPRTVDTFYS